MGAEKRRGADARRFEALGRVMAALATEAEILESCRDLTWWRSAGRGWRIEWRDGPCASEVAALLAGPGASAVVRGEATRGSAEVEVLGVPFELRAVDPLGSDRVMARRGLWRLAEALDTSRPTTARHPWEELLGG
ncbi:hypothetical protein Misp01_35870 [Microtetraspora sp. NBRC 13810]|uniref:hypothetical protein n=1 Tax=Microtetraspora sp. NBRC 13810 TaxID=3030990 RepID=UPI0024A5AB44|nr:hypothetical protein [Microtetraspora sp. NBRC 13810]GLW08457.1 hypothetical protein Misp01_35870 [Microtetraspora sp. NBRC 13810]